MVEKVAFGLDHKVKSWLIEGLTAMASITQEFPLNSLDEAVGLRTAYRIAGIHMKANSGATSTSIAVGETQYAAFPVTAICVTCLMQVAAGGLACRSCSKTLESGILGAVYVSPSADTSKVFVNTVARGHCFYFPAGHITCGSCHQPAIPQGITCPSCKQSHVGTTNIYLSLCRPIPSQNVLSIEDLVREAFKSEIEECEVQ